MQRSEPIQKLTQEQIAKKIYDNMSSNPELFEKIKKAMTDPSTTEDEKKRLVEAMVIVPAETLKNAMKDANSIEEEKNSILQALDNTSSEPTDIEEEEKKGEENSPAQQPKLEKTFSEKCREYDACLKNFDEKSERAFAKMKEHIKNINRNMPQNVKNVYAHPSIMNKVMQKKK